MTELLAIIGGATLFTIAIGAIMVAYLEFVEFIKRKKTEYRIKHRFDKPPTAKCYCIDCESYNRTTLQCVNFFEMSNRLVADNWFCYKAEPRKKVE